MTATRPRRTPAAVEHPRCDGCGWTLYERLDGTLRCIHATCDRRGQTVETLPRDIGSLAEEAS